MKRTAHRTNRPAPIQQQALFAKQVEISEGDGCHIVPVVKRRDGGTRYWCLKHHADGTAKYGTPAKACRTAHIPPVKEEEILTLDFAKYAGCVALWGAVPPVYDTTRQPLDRGVHVHTRVKPEDHKELDKTFRAVRIVGKNLPAAGLYIDELDAIYYMATTIFGYGPNVRDHHGVVRSNRPRVQMQHQTAMDDLIEAINLFGNIPTDFPKLVPGLNIPA